MPTRRSLTDRLASDEARGRHAYDVPGPPSTVDQPPSVPDWQAHHRRVTFYCPLELLEAVETEMVRSGRSKSRVIVDALREHVAEAR